MTVSYGTHLDDFTFDEFHAVVLREYAGLSHPVIVVDRKSLSCRFDSHKEIVFEE